MDSGSTALGSTDHQSETIYLKDYTAPNVEVEQVDLTFQIFDDHTQVLSTLKLKKVGTGALHLDGSHMELVTVAIDGKELSASDYKLSDEALTIKNWPDACVLSTVVRIKPQENKSLEGLYLAGEGTFADGEAMLVTQCEPEGFRRITYYPDRPDVLSSFTTRIEADQKLPTLLSNGDLIESGKLDDNRHFATWRDPFKKPAYLFAAVAANLSLLKDEYITSENRKVSLELYAVARDIEQCHVAMQALKDSMKWDEDNYGRAYDLSTYMIVATSTFNMGAMENKGLNIFNTACVLSTPRLATDARNLAVKSVIAHEYFHNWTGNRITCRDWFQLCLKEGLTVFRDQSFTADITSEAAQRIDDVQQLKARQFPEDAGPLAHPPRPDHFVEINNFYTATVYEKGAEIARMIKGFLGAEAYRAGTDEYFARFDGQAVTVEDFLDALSDGSGVDVRHFMDWYTQPGTPVVTASWEQSGVSIQLKLSQKTRQVSGFDAPVALPIPVSTAVFSRSGELLTEQVLMLTKDSDTFELSDLDLGSDKPVVSLLRGFSAPVYLEQEQSADQWLSDTALLMSCETDGFNQWYAASQLIDKFLLGAYFCESHAQPALEAYLASVTKVLPKLKDTDPALMDNLLAFPSENQLASRITEDYDPAKLASVIESAKLELARTVQSELEAIVSSRPSEYADTPHAVGARALTNTALAFLAKLEQQEQGDQKALKLAEQQYDSATCMTEQIGALKALVWYGGGDQAAPKLEHFFSEFSEHSLVIDSWFAVQASAPSARVDTLKNLSAHESFTWFNPNRARSVASSVAARPKLLWSEEGADFLLDAVKMLDSENPILASRMVQAFARWYTLAEPLKSMIKGKLEAAQNEFKSKAVRENVQNMISKN